MKAFILVQLAIFAQAFNLINDVPADLDPVEFFNSEAHLFDEIKFNESDPVLANFTKHFKTNVTDHFDAKQSRPKVKATLPTGMLSPQGLICKTLSSG